MLKYFHPFRLDAFLIIGLCCYVVELGAQSPPPRTLNEASVIRTMSRLQSAQSTYSATTGNGNFGTLAQLQHAGLIENSLAEGRKYHYLFVVTPTPATSNTPATYIATATPAMYRKGGRRSFFIDQTGELRGADKEGGVATASDPQIDSCVFWGLADNERCTIEDMRSLFAAQETFRATTGNGNYGSFEELIKLRLIRSDFADYLSRGYSYAVFIIVPNVPAGFRIQATPQIYGVTGRRSFFIDQSGILRGANKNGASANEDDPPIVP